VTFALISNKALWYLARGTGVVSLVLLTGVLALGVVTYSGAGAPRLPRFASSLLHRNLSLLVLAFLAVHIATSVLDPFAGIAWTDAVIPLAASYRPLWLGLGALAFDLLLALAITSLLRARLGLRIWRAVHWLAYACWPVALVHGLGTGSDVRSGWLLWIVVPCVAAVVVAACWRLAAARSFAPRWRVALGALVLLAPLLMAGWLRSGPLRSGWASHAGTPAPILQHARSVPAGRAASHPANRLTATR
jgi:sulfoxide reductase heme-binding subunit YedZ